LREVGLVAASPSYHVQLYHVLYGLEKDVYYAVDVDYSKEMHPAYPSHLLWQSRRSFLMSTQCIFLGYSNDAAILKN
jgi:hypothetical protein